MDMDDPQVISHHGSGFASTVRVLRRRDLSYVFRPGSEDRLLTDQDPDERENRINDPSLATLLASCRQELVERLNKMATRLPCCPQHAAKHETTLEHCHARIHHHLAQ